MALFSVGLGAVLFAPKRRFILSTKRIDLQLLEVVWIQDNSGSTAVLIVAFGGRS